MTAISTSLLTAGTTWCSLINLTVVPKVLSSGLVVWLAFLPCKDKAEADNFSFLTSLPCQWRMVSDCCCYGESV
uniref:Uncharacterized protein n=1 Tax=Ixodes ricinus TaxID=34613 RepID=A0A6B0UAK6_IXORI